jgi:hypothetical protein
LSAAHTLEEYLAQAAHNAELARFLRKEKPEYLDWAATCLFYSAVHYVNAYLTKCGQNIPRRHVGTDQGAVGRTNIVQQDRTLREIYPDYRDLDDDSRDARYELKHPTKPDYDTYLMPSFVRIKNFVQQKISS